jgi:hypothetical protein
VEGGECYLAVSKRFRFEYPFVGEDLEVELVFGIVLIWTTHNGNSRERVDSYA